MLISFPSEENWDATTTCIVFPAIINDELVICAISREALRDNFNGDELAAIECFRANRPAIEAKIKVLASKGRYEADGSIFIKSNDGA